MTKKNRISLLEEASYYINTAIANIRIATEGMDEEKYYERYIIAHLDNWANSTSSFDETIPKIISDIDNK